MATQRIREGAKADPDGAVAIMKGLSDNADLPGQLRRKNQCR